MPNRAENDLQYQDKDVVNSGNCSVKAEPAMDTHCLHMHGDVDRVRATMSTDSRFDAHLFKSREYPALHKVTDGCADTFSTLLVRHGNATVQPHVWSWRVTGLSMHQEDAQVF